MVKGCGLKCIKYCLFVFNLIFVIAGMGVLGIGAWMRIDNATFDPLLGTEVFPIVAYMLIGAGLFVFVVGFAGCLGAVKESKALLGVYLVFVIIIFLAEAAAGVLAFMFYEKILPIAQSYVNDTLMTKFGYEDYELVTKAVNLLQSEFQCCGLDSPQDWSASAFYNDPDMAGYTNGTVLPRSCCSHPEITVCNIGFDTGLIHSDGCLKALQLWIQENLKVIGGIAIGTAVIQLFGIVFTICLCMHAGDVYEL